MPSFDVVSEVDMHEVRNAVDQANREIGTRFDFKGSEATYELNEDDIALKADSEFQINQMMDILRGRLTKRNVDIGCLEEEKLEFSGKTAQQKIVLRQGIDQALAKTIVKRIKESKLKVQVAIQGEKVRVTGKKRDDLQQAISILKASDLGLPLQFTNFRD